MEVFLGIQATPFAANQAAALSFVRTVNGLIVPAIATLTVCGTYHWKNLQNTCVSKILRAILSFAVLFPVSAFANSGPSYDETLSFVLKKVDGNSYRQNDVNIQYSISSPTKCHLKFGEVEHGKKVYETHFIIDLSKLDPSRVSQNTSPQYTARWVHMKVFENKDSVEVVSKKTGSREKRWWVNGATIRLTRNDDIPRVARAVEHLIRLYGGKEALF